MDTNADLSLKQKQEKHKYTVKTLEKTAIEFTPIEPIYTFDDVILDEKVKEEILNAISFYEHKEKIFNQWNLAKVIKQPKSISINFYGETGTGKTMVSNAIASYLNLKIIKVNYADIESKYVGDTSKNLTKLFEVSKSLNAIILFDEADALLSKRVTNMNNASDVSVNQTRSVLLTLLDDYDGIVIFTTNFLSNYDVAFMRRIPYHIKFELPNDKVRADIFRRYLTDTIPHNIDIDELSKKCEGVSGSDIANAVMISALKTARENQNELKQLTIEESVAKILISKMENLN